MRHQDKKKATKRGPQTWGPVNLFCSDNSADADGIKNLAKRHDDVFPYLGRNQHAYYDYGNETDNYSDNVRCKDGLLKVLNVSVTSDDRKNQRDNKSETR